MAMKIKNEITIRSSAAEYLTFIAATGDDPQSFEMRYEDENIWLTQKMLATLYDVDVRTINEHMQKIYSDNELEQESTIRNFRIVQNEGSRQVARDIKHYNLQMIIAVGFKVNNERAVQFRKWVNQIVKAKAAMQISGLPGTDGRPVLPKTQPIDRRKKQDETNWQPLCIKCHNRKTKTKDQYRE